MMSSRRKIFRNNFVSPGIINPGDKIPGRRPSYISEFKRKIVERNFGPAKHQKKKKKKWRNEKMMMKRKKGEG
jgi:hypothetical protein